MRSHLSTCTLSPDHLFSLFKVSFFTILQFFLRFLFSYHMGAEMLKHNFFHSLCPIITKQHDKYGTCGSQGGIQAITILGYLPQIKKIWHLEIFLTQDHYAGGWKFQTATPPIVFIQSHPNFMRTLVAIGGTQEGHHNYFSWYQGL